MIEKIERYYLEINSIKDLKTKAVPSESFSIKEEDKNNFALNKFFYKQIGKKHEWVDRLIWQDKNWMDYVSKENLKTIILRKENNIVGYFELLFDNSELNSRASFSGESATSDSIEFIFLSFKA